MFIFGECIQKKHKVDLFVCGDTLSLIAHPSGIIMSPPTRNTYWLGVITSTKYFLVSTSSHFASLCLELSFLSPRVTLGNFSDYSSLVLLCGSVSLSRVLLRFCFFFSSFSFFLHFCHFLFHRRVFYFYGGFTLDGNDFLSFLFLLFLDF